MPWLLLAYPLLVHAAILLGWSSLEALALIVLTANLLTNRLRGGSVVAWIVFLVTALMAAAITASGDSRLFLYAAPSLITLALAMLFGRSLRRGATPIITRIADAIRGPLPEEVARYTRAVTGLWLGLFLAIALLNALLAILAPAVIWSWFANVGSYLLIGGVFVAEWLLRQRLLRGHESLGWWQYLGGLARIDYRQLFR